MRRNPLELLVKCISGLEQISCTQKGGTFFAGLGPGEGGKKVVVYPHLMTLEENKVEPPTMTLKEAIYAEVLAVISGCKEGVPAHGGNLSGKRS